MKKIGMILSSLLLVAGLVTGCGSTPAPEKSSSGEPADVQAIKDRGVLKVGVKVDVPNFGYKDPKTGEIDGLEIDLAKAVSKKIFGEEKIEPTAVTAKTRGPLLDSGDVDLVIATFTITEERKKSYNFSDPYFTDGVKLMVKKDSGIKSLKDLDGKKIGVAQSATSKKAIQEAADKIGVKVDFLEFSTYPEIKAALDSGRVDCFSVDGSILFGYLDDTTAILDDSFSPQDYGVASKMGNDGLAKLVNDTIGEMKSSGELDKLVQKWGLK
ncbi:periplasmic component of amino acid ABC-type transporter/signal transduction system [Desulfosporosinus orientis DSM 765]|uniref:Periplasmic component of amino acid ABC-type transporter/signal transduction system n=1 Tax=Desulfosporosinus orientis (strain ATCC 19365 / DSM 765 / NCIMB 8382 / VKM B-1628 / Singapore I) TaxID=768706 RepID=G7WA93_DESOD|nr:transporter substrate-binding domain-containing protein [Desulfosporosinus orientis]AET66231.1 periplasmic component of amino acid ABC-type transporter/signal transduction system [Desulfosporosinus orientis DSM 765]